MNDYRGVRCLVLALLLAALKSTSPSKVQWVMPSSGDNLNVSNSSTQSDDLSSADSSSHVNDGSFDRHESTVSKDDFASERENKTSAAAAATTTAATTSSTTTKTEAESADDKPPVKSQNQEPPPLPKTERNNNQHSTIYYDDEQTYLDLFGERAKELLTEHIIPATDANCRWDWRMGRCEPYCECGYYFLWGDYHLGRSCRLRSRFARVQSGGETKTSRESLQDAWEQWADQMDDPDAFASFVDSGNRAKKSQNNLNECSLPPESRYTQMVHHFTKLLGHGTNVYHQFQKVKHHAIKLASETMTYGKHKFNDGRGNACARVKRMIEARELERNQPVVLTRRGHIWVRRLCGSSNESKMHDSLDDQNKECNQNECP